jgi:ribonuclease HI
MTTLQTLLMLLARGETLEESWRTAGFSSREDASQALERCALSLDVSGASPGKMRKKEAARVSESPPGELDAAVVYVDGASRGNPGPSAVGAIVYLPSGEEILSAAKKIGRATNNVAEYRAVLEGLRLARQLKVRDLTVRLDSELVARQLNGRYRIRSSDLDPLAREVAGEARRFERCRFEHVPRKQNAAADRLANEALNLVGDP